MLFEIEEYHLFKNAGGFILVRLTYYGVIWFNIHGAIEVRI
jgi:hypothetical protein